MFTNIEKAKIKGDNMKKNDLYNLTNPQKNIWNTELFFSDTNVNNVFTQTECDR